MSADGGAPISLCADKRKVILAHPETGDALVAVGRALSDDEVQHLVRLDVLDVSIMIGPRNAILLARALFDTAGVILASEGAVSLALN